MLNRLMWQTNRQKKDAIYVNVYNTLFLQSTVVASDTNPLNNNYSSHTI